MWELKEISGLSAQKDLEELLGGAFSVPSGQSFFDDFPVWDERSGVEIGRFGAYDEARLISSASVRLARLKAPCGSLKIAIIGAVATAAEYRGEGLATRSVSCSVEWAKSRGAALILLWGSEHSLYRRLGFGLCGEQVRVPLGDLRGKSAISVHTGWNPAIFKLLQGRKSGLALDQRDYPWFSAHKNVEWFWTGNKDAPSAFAAIGRGIDLTGMVHEWGGDNNFVIQLLCNIECQMKGLEVLGSPSVFDEAGIPYSDRNIEFLCMAKILDARGVLRAFGRDDIRIDSAMPDDKLARFLFGPRGGPDFGSNSSPLPLWVWGLDAG